ncbi:hypothetical protein JXQ70_06885 [bacterium]|nr:hypothetical protein [bacterium]
MITTTHYPYHWFFLAAFSLVLIGLALTVNFQQSITGFVGDLAVYLCMGQSFAYDFDCIYARQDVYRVFRDWGTCPSGVFLKEVDRTLYYAKPIIYPLFAAPLVRLLDPNGFLLLNCLLLLGMIVLGYVYLRCYNGPTLSLLFSFSFFILQVGYVYAFTIVPEIMNMFLITAGYFLWLVPRHVLADSFKRYPRISELSQGKLRYALSAVLLGLAAFSKLTNALLFLGPILVHLFDRSDVFEGAATHEQRASLPKRVISVLLAGLVFATTIISMFGLQYYFTADFNPQGGNRKVFHYDDCPYSGQDRTFASGGVEISPDKTIEVKDDSGFLEKILSFIKQRAALLPARMFLTDLFYFFFGRMGGLLPFFPMTMVALAVVLIERTRRQILLLIALGLTSLLFLVVMPQNYVGGAALGNRYFINSYPVFLFLFTRLLSPHLLWFTWLTAGLFLSPLLLNPFQSNYHIGNFATRFPYTLLPLEQSLIANYPTNVDPKLNYVPFSVDPYVRHIPGSGQPSYNITFADHNTYGYEWAMDREGFWVRGAAKAQFVLRYPAPRFRVNFSVHNGAVPNTITLNIGRECKDSSEYYAGQLKTFSCDLSDPFPYFGHSLVKCSVRCSDGFMPRFFEDITSEDVRFLGCYVSIAVESLGPE